MPASGDIGNRMFDEYKKVAPSRFLNCGIAEANMMSMAAGMALNGLRPVVYTITPFTTTRCLEQIRTGVAYHEAPVVIVGTDQTFICRTWSNPPFIRRHSNTKKHPQHANLCTSRLNRISSSAKRIDHKWQTSYI